MRAVLDGLLSILAPLVTVVHDFGVSPGLNRIARLSHPLHSWFLPWPTSAVNTKLIKNEYTKLQTMAESIRSSNYIVVLSL